MEYAHVVSLVDHVARAVSAVLRGIALEQRRATATRRRDLPVAAATRPGRRTDAAADRRRPARRPGSPGAPDEPLEALRQERDELKDQLLRRRADFENYQQRVERDREHARRPRRRPAIFAELLADRRQPRARARARAATRAALRAGVELILRELLGLLERHGRHGPSTPPASASTRAPTRLLPRAGRRASRTGTVAEVFRKGYTYKDRLLRPALVKVAKGEDAGSRRRRLGRAVTATA